MPWLQLRIDTSAELAEQVGNMLDANGAQAVTFVDAKDTPMYEPKPGDEGRLGKREITPGILGNNDSIIATLDDSTKLKVDIKLPENYVGILKNGLKVQASSDAFDKIFNGEIKTVSSRVDPTSRSILAQIEILNPNLELIPGILLNIKVIYDEKSSLSIPEESLVIQGNSKFVYLIENNVLKRQNIKIGLRNFGKVEVLSGLMINDKIVAEGTNKVRNKAKVKIKK